MNLVDHNYAAGSVVACAGAGAVFFGADLFATDFFTGAVFFAAFAGAVFTAALFTAVCFLACAVFFPAADFALVPAFCNRQRFFVAAMILFMPSSLMRRSGFSGSGVVGADGSDSPRILAHRRC